MKLKIAAGTVGLAALLFVPATQGHAVLSPGQCEGIHETIVSLDSAISAWPVDAPQSGLNKLIRHRNRLENRFENGGCSAG